MREDRIGNAQQDVLTVGVTIEAGDRNMRSMGNITVLESDEVVVVIQDDTDRGFVTSILTIPQAM